MGGANSASGSFVWGVQGGAMSVSYPLTLNTYSAPTGGSVAPTLIYEATITVVDTVGTTATRAAIIGLPGYDPPLITSLEAVRCDSAGNETVDGSYLKVKGVWTYSSMSGENAITSSTFVWGQEGEVMSGAISATSNAWSNPLGGNLLQNRRYAVTLTIADRVNGIDIRTVIVPVVPPMPGHEGDYWGLLSTWRTQGDFRFEAPVAFNILFTQPQNINGLHFIFNVFDDSYCDDMTIQFVYSDSTTKTVHLNPDAANYYLSAEENDVEEIGMLFNGMNKADRFLWIQRLIFGHSYSFDHTEIVSHAILREFKIASDDLAIGTMDSSLILQGDSLMIPFNRRGSIQSFFRGDLQGVFFLDDVERTARNRYAMRCTDIIGHLDAAQYDGMMFFSADAAQIVQSIASASGVTITMDGSISKPVTGYLQKCSCRYALMQVAFALGAVIDINVGGTISIRKIQDHVTSYIGAERIKMGASIRKDKFAVSEVRLASWAYALQAITASPLDSSNNTTNAGWDVVGELPKLTAPQIVTVRIEHEQGKPYGTLGFGAPYMYSAGAVRQDIFTWLNAGQPNNMMFNYGTTNTTLFNSLSNEFANGTTIKRVPYMSAEEVYVRTNPNVFVDDRTQILEYNTYTLRSESNAREVLDLLYGLAISKTETVAAQVILENEKVGDLVEIETDFGPRTGLITMMNTSVHSSRIAKMEVRV
jgi:hypothetical protein